MGILSVFSWVKGEEYGKIIGEEMDKGLSIEEAVRVAYKKLGIIPLWRIYSHAANPYFISAMGGVISGFHNHKIGFFNQKLIAALAKVTKEMT